MLVALSVVVFSLMLVEARRAWRNERAQLARGGIEPPDDVYNTMRVVYPAAFLAMIAEVHVGGASLVAKGPYRYLRHPNYAAVIGELAAVALMTGARFTGPIVTLVFSLIILRRVAVEEKALSGILAPIQTPAAQPRNR